MALNIFFLLNCVITSEQKNDYERVKRTNFLSINKAREVLFINQTFNNGHWIQHKTMRHCVLMCERSD